MAFITDIDIANMALAHVGNAAPISSFDEDTSEAAHIRRYYNTTRLSSLEKHDWSFARKVVSMEKAADDPTDGWSYAYVLPADCVAPRAVRPAVGGRDEQLAYTVQASEGGTRMIVLTDEPEAQLRYTFDQRRSHMFSQSFILAFSHMLAAYVGYAIDKKDDNRKTQFELSEFAIERARNIDNEINRKTMNTQEYPTWLDARYC